MSIDPSTTLSNKFKLSVSNPSPRTFKQRKVLKTAFNRATKASILFHNKIVGIIKCLRVGVYPFSKQCHELKSRAALLSFPPNTIHLFYRSTKVPTVSWVYEYDRCDLTYGGISKDHTSGNTSCNVFGNTSVGILMLITAVNNLLTTTRTLPMSMEILCMPSHRSASSTTSSVDILKLSVSRNSVSLSCNYVNTITHKHISSRPEPSSLGAAFRFKTKRPGEAYIPQLNYTDAFDFYHFTCQESDAFNAKLDDLLLSLCKKKHLTSILVKPGQHDATYWCAVCGLFGDVAVAINGSQHTMELRHAKRPIHRRLVTLLQIVEFKCDAVFATLNLI